MWWWLWGGGVLIDPYFHTLQREFFYLGVFLKACGMECCFPFNIAGLLEAWENSPVVGCGRTLWRLIPISILWSIWKERNERIFNNKDSLGEDIVSTMVLRIAKWACLRKECPDLIIDNMLHN